MAALKDRLGSLISAPVACLLLICFFLPWLELSCDPSRVASSDGQTPTGMKMILATFSGWQLATGEMTASPKRQPQGQDPAGVDKPSKGPEPRVWFFVCLAVPIVILLGSLMVMRSPGMRKKWGMIMVLLAMAGGGVSCAALGVDLLEGANGMSNKEASGDASSDAMSGMMEEKMKEAMGTDGLYGLWLTLGGYGLLLAVGIVDVTAKPKTKGKRSRPAEAPEPKDDGFWDDMEKKA